MGDFTGLPATPFGPGERVRISRERRLLAIAETTAECNQVVRLVRVFQ